MSQREKFVMRLFDQYQSFLHTLCWRYVKHDPLYADAIDECVLDTFMQAYLAYETLRHHPNVQGWLTATCLNRLKPRIRQMKSRNARQAFSVDDPQAPPLAACGVPEEAAPARDELAALYAALTENERLVFQDHYLQGYTLQAVANRQQRSLASVKATVRQIKKKAEKIKNSDDFSG